MIEKKYLIEEDNGYARFNLFEISDELEEILTDDYYTYNSKDFTKSEFVENLYKSNFTEKYDKDTQSEIFDLYINNEKFKEKVFFIYSVIDKDKYRNFVEKYSEIENPDDITIKYSVIDSDNTKVLMYNISIADIAFVF
ncbi:MAG: hypothetical protein C0626_08950 [Arcobacter sp.]|uniref:hypothetical protein n=1 Tax=uncultured Arcobacter sp. TaxID=165434 RepID=UPI000CC55F69|nr:hypothetical protein [uncultured Arcobacter sp.]PLY09127.1 MAG: hypothetical protein C0626_08950 [Arcobacter sp.]